MEKILTAEEFLKQKGWYNEECTVNYLMIEFAKMHCKAQAEIIAEKQKGYWYNGEFINGTIISKDSILTAYSEKNIV